MNISNMNIGRHGFHPDFESRIRQQKLERQVTAIVLGLTLITGGNGLAVVGSEETEFNDKAVSESNPPAGLNDYDDRRSLSPANSRQLTEATNLLISQPKPIPEIFFQPPASTAPVPKPKPTDALKPTAPKVAPKVMSKPPVAAIRKKPAGFTMAEIRPMSDTTKNNLDKMELSVDRYQNFVTTIDTSHLDFAQQFTPFNPNKVAIEQRQTEFFTLHYTAFYSNFGESSKTQPVGDMDVRKLIHTMGSRGDICCGINWILDRTGKAYQTAPVAAKLRHNPPFDSITTGVEVEASDQDAITPKQYETLTYLTIAVLKHQGQLDKELAKVVRGHGEDRDEYRQNNPGTKWEVRNDFDGAVSTYFRSKVGLFLKENSDIKNISVNLK